MATKPNKVYTLTYGDKEIFKKASDPYGGVGVNYFTSYYFGGREMRAWQWMMHHAAQRQITIVGGVGCVSEDTILEGHSRTIADLAKIGEPIEVFAFDGQSVVKTMATAPYIKGEADLYEVTFSDGKTITVTEDHKFLTNFGYLPLYQIGSLEVYAIEHERPGLEKASSWRDHSWTCALQYDGQLLRDRDSVQDIAPLQADVHELFPSPHLTLTGDDFHQAPEPKYSACHYFGAPFGHDFQVMDCQSYPDFCGSYSTRVGLLPTPQQQQTISDAFEKVLLNLRLSGAKEKLFVSPMVSLFPDPLDLFPDGGVDKRRFQEYNPDTLPPFSRFGTLDKSLLIDPGIYRQNDLQVSCISPDRSNCTSYYKISKVHIIKVAHKGIAKFMDLHVPGYNNYLAHGVINHNSGKTVGAGLSYATWAAMTPMYKFMNLASTCPLP